MVSMKEVSSMENNEMGIGNGTRNARTGYLARVNLFWLIVGGLMLFFGATAILQRMGIWSEIDARNAGDGVVVLLGIMAIAYALKDHRNGTGRESA